MTEESAIQSDAQDDDTPAAPQPSERELAMQVIADRNAALIAAELGIQPEMQEAETGTIEPAPAVQEQQIEQQTDETLLDGNFDRYKVKTKVNGIEREVSLDDVLRRFQKNEAADARLAEATRLLEAAEQREREVIQIPVTEQPEAKATLSASVKDVIAALYEGDEGKAAQALESLFGRQSPIQSVDSADIARQVKEQLTVEGALERGVADYAHIASDPFLAGIADRYVEAHIADGKPMAEAISMAFQDADKWLKGKTGAVSPPAITTDEAAVRNQRKRSQAVPRVANVTAPNPNQQTPMSEEQIRAEAMAELKKSRPGQGY